MAGLENFETVELLAELKRRYACLGKPEGNFVFLGPPGTGKGTQSANIKNSHCYCHLSTGDILREAIREKSALGKKAQEYVDQGQLVPSELLRDIVCEKISSPKCRRGFILDGYPRTEEQAEDLEKILKKTGKKLNGVLFFNLPDEEIEKRLTGRLIHPESGRVYHTVYKPPKVPNLDDIKGEPLIRRTDDTRETIKIRLDAYRKLTFPLVSFYQKRNMLHNVDCNQKEDQVTKSVEKLIKNLSK